MKKARKINLLLIVLFLGFALGWISIVSNCFQAHIICSERHEPNNLVVQSSYMEYQVIQITSNDYYDSLGQIDNGLIVWQGDVQHNGNNEIFLYNIFTGETTQITHNYYDDRLPQIDNGIITWIGNVDGDYEVFMYDSGMITQLTDTSYTEQYPRIDDGIITWYGGRGSPSIGDEIFYYDCISKQITRITDNQYSDYSPQTNSGLITWWGWGGAGMDIFLYNTYSNSKIQITHNSNPDTSTFPIIHDGLVVWLGQIAGVVRLFLYDYLTNEIIPFTEPNTYGSYSVHDNIIVYDAQDNEIYAYYYERGTPGNTIRITNDYVVDKNPKIHDGLIVWDRNQEIAIFDLNTNSMTQITHNTYYDGYPLIHDGVITWIGKQVYEIFIAKPAWISATVNLDPNTLNLKCKGKWVTGYIELPSEYNVADIDITTVLLQNSIPAELTPSSIGDFDEDGILDLMVKFNRASLQSLVLVGNSVEISISGALTNCIMFSGFDIIKVIDQGNDHINEEDPSSVA